MDDLKSQIKALPDDQWQMLLAWAVGEERERRAALPLIEESRAEDRDALWEVYPELRPAFVADAPEEVEEGALFPPYEQPAGAHDCYPLGAGVSEGGRNYRSLHPANVWPPSTPHPGLWEEVPVLVPEPDPEPEPVPDQPVEEPAPADPPAVEEWVQPTGAHDAYNTGDRVRFEGHIYRSLIDGNAHSPAAYPAGWEKED